jgi:hypothetical protein
MVICYKSYYPVVKKISCDVIIENKYPKLICCFIELNVKKGKQTCTCFYEQIDCACKTNFRDYIIGIDNVKKRGHLHNMICKTGYNPLAHCEKS